ncbi:MAG: hypothetical protein KDC12_08560 [Flavobacteriales bacterium]|nr:hypothetical protein [Flavobacteriales bacterium]
MASQLTEATVAVDTVGTGENWHSPRKATIMSAVLPGLGQAYNKKYWKIPVVYAAMGVTTYFVVDNHRQFKYYKENLIAALDTDTTTINVTPYTSSQLNTLQDTYRRWRDLSVIILSVEYILNIIDANVDAHLYHFDVSDDLSMCIQPYIHPAFGTKAGLTLSFTF